MNQCGHIGNSHTVCKCSRATREPRVGEGADIKLLTSVYNMGEGQNCRQLNNNRQRVHTVKLLIMLLFSFSYYFLSVRSKYSFPHYVLKHSEFVFLPYTESPCLFQTEIAVIWTYTDHLSFHLSSRLPAV